MRSMPRIVFVVLACAAIAMGALQAQPADSSRVVLYAALGPELVTHAVNASDGTLARSSSVTLPFAVQYVWEHPSKKYLYAAWSNGMQGDRHGVTAFRIDPATGGLTPHGKAIALRHRPVHVTLDRNATHLLAAYNNPSGLSVHNMGADGSLGGEVLQPPGLDGGIYAHQVRVDPSNKMVVLVTRGNGPAPKRAEDPGALKVFSYNNGVLANRQSIAPNGGFGFQPRHVDFHPTQPWVYLNLERQNQLQMYRSVNGESLEPKARHTKDTLDDPAHSKPAQMTGAIHVHPNGRFLYLSNRASGTVDVEGRRLWEGGENTIGVYALDPNTGEPRRIQNEDTRGMHARTFTLDDRGRILVVGNQSAVTVRQGTTEPRVPASLAVFRIGADGKLTYIRKYDVETGQGRSLMWVGMVTVGGS
jgi:6-phosphogluconolactonase